MNADTVQFQHGHFNGIAFNVTMYRDGAVISSAAHTDVIDEIFSDLRNFAKETLNVETFKTHNIDKIYESVFVFFSEKDLLFPIRSLSSIGFSISNRLKDINGSTVEFLPFGLSLSHDATKVSGLKPTAFRLERRGGTDFSLNQYFSSAPLKTKDHIAVIEELEKLVQPS